MHHLFQTRFYGRGGVIGLLHLAVRGIRCWRVVGFGQTVRV